MKSTDGGAATGAPAPGRKCGIPISGRAPGRNEKPGATLMSLTRPESSERRRRRFSAPDDFHFRPSGRMHINSRRSRAARGPLRRETSPDDRAASSAPSIASRGTLGRVA